MKEILNLIEKYGKTTLGNSLVAYAYEVNRWEYKYLKVSDAFRKTIKSADENAIEDIKNLNIGASSAEIMDVLEIIAHSDVDTAIYTPEFIVDYMVSQIRNYNLSLKILDPSCGCGAILTRTISRIADRCIESPISIVNSSIYGFEIDEFSAHFCKMMIEMVCLEMGYSTRDLNPHIYNVDSIKSNWSVISKVDKFDYIFGNPPYKRDFCVSKEDKDFYALNYHTAQGRYNLAHVFVEKSLSNLRPFGTMCFLVTNSVFTKKSSSSIREYVKNSASLYSLIDFFGCDVFKNTSIGACLMTFRNEERTNYNYARITDNASASLKNIEDKFETREIKDLDTNGWLFIDEDKNDVVYNAERFDVKIGNYLVGSVATLADGVFIINDDYTATANGKTFHIEPELTRKMYRARDVKKNEDPGITMLYPYYNDCDRIEEEELKEKFPNAYAYLLENKPLIEKKPGGRRWYEFGKKQYMKTVNKKSVFCVYNREPSFCIPKDPSALIIGGIGITEDIPVDAFALNAVLNSSIMKRYIEATSYALSGGYCCYQNKYIKDFSIPSFSDEEIEEMKKMNKEELDKFLVSKYGLKESA